MSIQERVNGQGVRRMGSTLFVSYLMLNFMRLITNLGDHHSSSSKKKLSCLDTCDSFQFAKSLLDEKQKDETTSANDGFYESRREWMGKRHFLLAFEG